MAEKEQKTRKKNKKTWRKLKTLQPMAMISPFIMVNRVGSQNLIRDRINVANAEQYIKEKQQQGMKNFSMMHLIIAAYIRTVSQRPGLNRFIRGQRVYTRDDVEIALTIKQELKLNAPETVVKVIWEKDATAEDVYNDLNKVITDYRNQPGSDFDKTAKILTYIPAVFLKFVVWNLKLFDYFGLLIRPLTSVSPFHCSFFITSMGSLGIPPIFHHLYDFGTCPAFCSFGAKERAVNLDADQNLTREQYVDLGFALDERICDGHYFANSYRYLKNILKNPWVLDNPPEQVIPDID